MPTKRSNLVKQKKNIIHDIIFENIIPNTNPETFWALDMLTSEIRRHNIDTQIRINKYDVKKVMNKLTTKRKDITLHIINNNLYFKFLS